MSYGRASQAIIGGKDASNTRAHPEARECEAARQWKCTVSESQFREVTAGSEKGMAFQADVDKQDAGIVKEFMEQHEKETPSVGPPVKAGMTQAERAEKLAQKKREHDLKLANDIPYIVNQWLNGIGKDLIKATPFLDAF